MKLNTKKLIGISLLGLTLITSGCIEGADGAAGTNGVNGTDGVDGARGENGLNVLINTTTEIPGNNCMEGGIKVNVGLDADQNGTLESSEITSTRYVCNGAAALTETSFESDGENCTAGGTKTQTGLDNNGNGILDANEVTNTAYACNGLSTLINTTTLDAGDTNCLFGGIQIEVGLSEDGTLDSNEVNATTYVCNGADGLDGETGPTGADGTDGLDGATGATGADGTDGLDGATGLNTLVLMTPEGAGTNCENNGTKVEVGLDDNRNGTLETGEIDATTYVCNALDAPTTEEVCLLNAGGYIAINVGGRTWLDRNLGASTVGVTGDYYQWGRKADGHQIFNSPITPTQATTLTPDHGNFITLQYWTSADLTQAEWDTPYGTNQVCPCGFVIPSLSDVQAMGQVDHTALNLTTGGIRQLNGNIYDTNEGWYWIADRPGDAFSVSNFNIYGGTTGTGLSVRCIKPNP